jgi:trigger factor
VEETNAFPLTVPVVENETLKEGQAFKYSALMEVKPEFELKEYTGLEAEKETCSITDDDVAGELEEIRKAHGKLSPIEEERGAREDDHVLMEYEAFDGEMAMEGLKSNNFLLRIGSGDFHPDFERALTGLKKGDETEIKVDFEDDYRHASLAGKSVLFKVKVIDIKKMDLPELDDEFIRDLGGGFADLDDLKGKIKESLITREEKRIDRELKMNLLKKISDRVDFELPESLVESEINSAVERIRQNLIRTGSSIEKAGITEEKLKEEFRPASEKRVKEMLILAEIASQNNLSVSDLELSEGFGEMAVSIGQEPEVLRKYYEANNLVESYRQQLLEEKALSFLVKSARVNELAVPEAEGKETWNSQPVLR